MNNRIFFVLDFVLIVLIGAFAINTTASTWLREYMVANLAPDGHSRLQVNSLKTNIFFGNIQAERLTYKDDTEYPESITIEDLNISGISVFRLLIQHKLFIRSIEVNGSVFVHHLKKDSAKKDQDFFDGKKINEIHVGNLKLNNASVKIADKDVRLFTCEDSNLEIDQFYATKGEKAGCKFIKGQVRSSKFLTRDSLYTMEIDEVIANSTNRNAVAGKFRLIPNYDEKTFSVKTGHQTDRFKITINDIRMGGFDICDLLFDDRLEMDTLTIANGNIDVLRDKYFEVKKERKKLIRELVNDLNLKIHIRQCRVTDSQLTYKEIIPPATKPGGVQIGKMNATIYDISKSDSTIILESTGVLNNTSPISIRLNFPPKENIFYGNGFIKQVDMKALNPLMEAESGISITNGTIDSMHFDMKGIADTINGSILMIYHDLRVTAINVANRDTTGLLKSLKSMVANTFVLKHSDKQSGEAPAPVNVSFEYRKDKFITYNIIHTIISGINKTVK